MEIIDTRNPLGFQVLVDLVRGRTSDIIWCPEEFGPYGGMLERIKDIIEAIKEKNFAFVDAKRLVDVFREAYTPGMSNEILEIIASIIRPYIHELKEVEDQHDQIFELTDDFELELKEEITQEEITPSLSVSAADVKDFFGRVEEVISSGKEPSRIGPLTQIEKASVPLNVREAIEDFFKRRKVDRQLKTDLLELVRAYADIYERFGEDFRLLKGSEAKAIYLNGRLRDLKPQAEKIKDVGLKASSFIKQVFKPAQIRLKDIVEKRKQYQEVIVQNHLSDQKRDWTNKLLSSTSDELAIATEDNRHAETITRYLEQIISDTAELEAFLRSKGVIKTTPSVKVGA